MKSYFFSGNTPVVNGKSEQSCGIQSFDDDVSPTMAFQEIIKDRIDFFKSESFVLTALNEVPYVKPTDGSGRPSSLKLAGRVNKLESALEQVRTMVCDVQDGFEIVGTDGEILDIINLALAANHD